MENEAMTSAGSRHRNKAPYNIIFPSLSSTGKFRRCVPSSLRSSHLSKQSIDYNNINNNNNKRNSSSEFKYTFQAKKEGLFISKTPLNS